MEKSMSVVRLFVLTASALAVASAYADTGTTNERSKAEFKSLDIDGDGLVSKAEAAGNAEVVQAFDRADRNRDGKLSAAEYERYGKAQAKAKAKSAARKAEGSASAGATKPRTQGTSGR
jgi:Ca2+-binding EF-hand superfamily protein